MLTNSMNCRRRRTTEQWLNKYLIPNTASTSMLTNGMNRRRRRTAERWVNKYLIPNIALTSILIWLHKQGGEGRTGYTIPNTQYHIDQQFVSKIKEDDRVMGEQIPKTSYCIDFRTRAWWLKNTYYLILNMHTKRELKNLEGWTLDKNFLQGDLFHWYPP